MRGSGGGPPHQYVAYGVGIASEVPLALPRPQPGDRVLARVACRHADSASFRDAREQAVSLDNFHRIAFLTDGAIYLGWDTVGEFIVSANGGEIDCCPVAAASWESFQVYMLGQALSFALVKRRIEPLHATVIAIDGEAVAFLGDSAHGKSSLGACFVHAGHRLLTDDLLVVEPRHGRMVAHPGPPRIKLFPAVARKFLPRATAAVRMNAGTEKLVLPLGDHQQAAAPIPVTMIYSVTAPQHSCRRPDIGIAPLSRREALMRLLAATFNRRYVPRSRLLQQFETMTAVADRVPVHTLSYPRSIDRLAEVKDQILARRFSPERLMTGSIS
jgi:hypothetical protein